MTYALGKLPPAEDARTLQLADYRTAPPPAARQFGFGEIVSDWGMLGNDEYGDCVLASAAHQTMLFTTVRAGLEPALFTTKGVLSDYSALTGFSPKDPDTDQGTIILDALKYRVHTGVIDSSGERHKIAAYAQLDLSWDAMLAAAQEFGVVELGIEFPESAFDQFDRNVYWDTTLGQPNIVGGHDVCIVGSRNSKQRVTCITWGRRQQLTRRFYEAFCDEAWVPLSEEMIRADGTGLHGYDWARFQRDLAAL